MMIHISFPHFQSMKVLVCKTRSEARIFFLNRVLKDYRLNRLIML